MVLKIVDWYIEDLIKLYPQPMDLLVNSLKLHSLSSPKTFNLGELESQPVGCIVIENLGG